MNITKKEFVDNLSTVLNESKKHCGEIYDACFQIMADQLVQGNEINIIGFGSFKMGVVKGREGYSKMLDKSYKSEDHYKVVFKPSNNLKDAVRQIPIEK